MNNLLDLNSVGLVYDGIGVSILGYAFFSTKISAFFLNSQTFYGGNAGVLEAGIETRTDGITGTALLIVGFVLQWLGANNYKWDAAGLFLLGFLALFLLCYFLFFKKKATKFQLRKAKEFEEKWKRDAS
ncbi:MAG: hypothetical protein HY322_07780 [Betaproteobacteria bacterium]|nr:hypothetical protein [Betaproteobacteria bacterium]